MDDTLQVFNLTNYRPHPSMEKFVVFFFKDDATADTFESLMKDADLRFERDIQEGDEDSAERHLFGIRRTDLEQVKKLNYTALGRHRKGFISDPIIRWGVMIIFLLAFGLALWGYIKTNFSL